MATSLLDLFRALASFEPRRAELSDAPWEAYVDWAISNALAPMAAYNLEYRLGQCGAPQWARDRLLSVFQGTANDNVMKLVNFKKVVAELAGRRVALLEAAVFADTLYPHFAFRPVGELRCLVSPGDLEPFTHFLAGGGFEVDPSAGDPARAERRLTDHRTTLLLHGTITPSADLDRELLERCIPAKAYGLSIHRPQPEDALLVHAVLMARAGFAVPLLELVDVRELVLGAQAASGPYSRALDVEAVLVRARAWKAERALWASLAIAERLFPEIEPAAASLKPNLPFAIRELIERLVVGPVAEVGRRSLFRGEESVRSLLVGG
jgi:hypothetical protein